MKANRFLALGLTTLAGLASNTLSAANAAGAAAVALDEVVITAEKREDTLQKTALSVTAVSGEEINKQGRNDITDVLKDVAGVTLNNSPLGNYQVNIRGVAGGGLPGFDGDPGASINLDGVYNSPLVGGPSQIAFYDVTRVEVLRGPQGTLYGRNAESGAVNLITGDPGKEFDASGTLEFGSYSLVRAAGMVNTPVSDNWALRGAFTSINRDGYFTSGGGAAVGTSGRVKLQYDSGKAFRTLLGVEYTKVGGTVGVGGMGAGIAAWGLGDPPTDPYDDVTKNGGVSGSIPGTSQNNRLEKTWAQIEWDTGIGTLTVVPAHIYARNQSTVYTLANMAAPGLYAQLPTVASGKEDVIEARLTSSATSAVNWIVGAFYMKARNSTTATAYMGAYSNNTVIVNAESTAAFGQITYPLSEAMRLIGGVRTTKDNKDFYASNPTNAGFPGVPGGGAGSWSRFDYKAGFEMDLNPSSLLFAHVATGYRPGSVTTGSASLVAGPGGVPVVNRNLTTKPEYLTAFEIGSKNQFLDNRLRVNADAYYYDYRDRQYTYFTTQATLGVPCPNGQLPLQFGADVVCLIELNANKVRMMGAEIETQWLVSPNDQIDLALSLLDAQGAATQLVQVANPNPLPATPREFNIDINGKTMPNSPRTQLNLAYQHTFNTARGTFTPRVDARYQSETYLQAFQYLLDVVNVAAGYREGNKYIQKARTIYDLSLNYSSADEKWNVNAYVKNAGDRIYKTITDGSVTTAGTPRTYGVVLSVRR